MSRTLQDAFAEARSPWIEVEGERIWAIYEVKGRFASLSLRLLNWNHGRTQAINVSSRDGLLVVNNRQGHDFVLLAGSAPEVVSIEIKDPDQLQTLRLWNSWTTERGVTSAWTANAGMRVSETNGGFLLECSDGMGRASFNDLVVQVELVER